MLKPNGVVGERMPMHWTTHIQTKCDTAIVWHIIRLNLPPLKLLFEMYGCAIQAISCINQRHKWNYAMHIKGLLFNEIPLLFYVNDAFSHLNQTHFFFNSSTFSGYTLSKARLIATNIYSTNYYNAALSPHARPYIAFIIEYPIHQFSKCFECWWP